MIRQLYFLVLFVNLMLETFGEEDITAEQIELLSDINNRFALKMLKFDAGTRNKSQNLFQSPYSLSLMLAIISLGARGKTKRELMSTTGFNNFPNNLHATFREISDMVMFETTNATIKDATGVFLENSLEYKDQFFTDVTDYYDVTLDNLPENTGNKIKKYLNGWVSEHTENKITDLFSDASFVDVAMILVNTVIFKGFWKTSFPISDTITSDFKMDDGIIYPIRKMQVTYFFNYYSSPNDAYSMIELPYKGEEFSMFIILPHNQSDNNVDKVLTKLDSDKIEANINSMTGLVTSVSLPKFNIAVHENLETTLGSLGFKDAFAPDKADFTGISDRKTHIASFVQENHITVNEMGTDVYGAAAITLKYKFMPPTVKIFDANRPFIFFIREKSTKIIFFLGLLRDPGQIDKRDIILDDEAPKRSFTNNVADTCIPWHYSTLSPPLVIILFLFTWI